MIQNNMYKTAKETFGKLVYDAYRAAAAAGELPEAELAALFAARAPLLAEDTAAAFWLGLLHGKLGRALWAAAALG